MKDKGFNYISRWSLDVNAAFFAPIMRLIFFEHLRNHQHSNNFFVQCPFCTKLLRSIKSFKQHVRKCKHDRNVKKSGKL